VQYFQYSKPAAERQIHALTLFHILVMVLDVFSEFFALEHRIVPKEWQFEVIPIGTALEREVARLQDDNCRPRSSRIPRIRHRRSKAYGLVGSFRRLGCGSGAGPVNLLPLPTREEWRRTSRPQRLLGGHDIVSSSASFCRLTETRGARVQTDPEAGDPVNRC
jgi:hypothetical protein